MTPTSDYPTLLFIGTLRQGSIVQVNSTGMDAAVTWSGGKRSFPSYPLVAYNAANAVGAGGCIFCMAREHTKSASVALDAPEINLQNAQTATDANALFQVAIKPA
jgi:hypothetical protein